MNPLLYDLRTAARGVLDAALFTLAILGLVVGLAAAAALVATVSCSMRPLFPGSTGSRVVEVTAPAPESCRTLMSPPDFLDYQVAAVAGECSRS